MTYVGFTTKDVQERMDEHNRGLTRTTATHIPWSIETVITSRDRERAEAFERYLKNGSGYAFAKRHLWSPCSAELRKAENPRNVTLCLEYQGNRGLRAADKTTPPTAEGFSPRLQEG